MSVTALDIDGLDREGSEMAACDSTKTRLPSVEKYRLLVSGISGIAIVVAIFATDIYLALKYLR